MTAKEPIISPWYIEENRILHQSPEYGATVGVANLEQAAKSITALATHIGARSILDFGCGKGTRAAMMRKVSPNIAIFEFDPAIPGRETLPASADMVIAMDVMEHIEPDYLDRVLESIRDVCSKMFVASIALVPAVRTLSDGRNAHLILESGDWWVKKIGEFFRVEQSSYIEDQGKKVSIGITATPKKVL